MKSKRIFIIMIIFLLVSCSIVMAKDTDTYKISLEASNLTLKEGENVNITLKVSDIDIQSGEKGIGAYEGTVIYDKEIFELIKIQGNENWDTPIQNEGKFISVKSDGECTSESQELATIILKVKEQVKNTKTEIEIADFEASNGEENISTDNAKLAVKVDGSVKSNIWVFLVIAILVVTVVIIIFIKKRK